MPGLSRSSERTSASPGSSRTAPQPAVALDVGIEMAQPAGCGTPSRALSARSKRGERRGGGVSVSATASVATATAAPAPRDRRQAAGRSPWPSRASSAPRGRAPRRADPRRLRLRRRRRQSRGQRRAGCRGSRRTPIGQVGHLGVAALLAGRQARAQVARGLEEPRGGRPRRWRPAEGDHDAARHAAAAAGSSATALRPCARRVRGVARQQDHAQRAVHRPLCLGQGHLGHRGRHGVASSTTTSVGVGPRRRPTHAPRRGIPEAGHRAHARRRRRAPPPPAASCRCRPGR